MNEPHLDDAHAPGTTTHINPFESPLSLPTASDSQETPIIEPRTPHETDWRKVAEGALDCRNAALFAGAALVGAAAIALPWDWIRITAAIFAAACALLAVALAFIGLKKLLELRDGSGACEEFRASLRYAAFCCVVEMSAGTFFGIAIVGEWGDLGLTLLVPLLLIGLVLACGAFFGFFTGLAALSCACKDC
ncbi:MAG: hypothetical protein QM811_06615 [Pirellulales bacterium]